MKGEDSGADTSQYTKQKALYWRYIRGIVSFIFMCFAMFYCIRNLKSHLVRCIHVDSCADYRPDQPGGSEAKPSYILLLAFPLATSIVMTTMSCLTLCLPAAWSMIPERVVDILLVPLLFIPVVYNGVNTCALTMITVFLSQFSVRTGAHYFNPTFHKEPLVFMFIVNFIFLCVFIVNMGGSRLSISCYLFAAFQLAWTILRLVVALCNGFSALRLAMQYLCFLEYIIAFMLCVIAASDSE